MRATVRLISLLLLTVALAVPAAAQDPPLVIAVDTSRSLTSADLALVRERLADVIDDLGPGTPLGLVSFADQARWVAPLGSSREDVRQALDSLEPHGNLTVLNDALFIAVRDMPAGGVVLVVTDGRDEGSATTVEDVARLAESNHVPVVATSNGRRVEERALRRLALLTDGAYVGTLRSVDPGDLAATLTATAASVREARAAAEAAAPAATSAPVPTLAPAEPAATAQAGRGALPRWALPLVVLVLAAIVVAFVVAQRRRRRVETRRCPTCGAELEPWETDCPHCQMKELDEAVRTQPVATVAVPEEPALDPSVFERAPQPPGLDRTMVLDEQPVLVARHGARSGRSYTLPRDKVFAVGRAPDVNTLEVEDPTMSSQHFKVVPKDGEFFVVDLETTNGTWVNHDRVSVRRLQPGDVIRAGTAEFEFKLNVRRVG